jgi:hypothetical protein
LVVRRNPPLTDEQAEDPQPRGGECAVWALAAASGRSVPEARRILRDAGIDIWDEQGVAQGTSMKRLAAALPVLDLKQRIHSIGFGGSRLVGVVGRHYGEKFLEEVPDVRSSVDSKRIPTVGSLVALCERKGLACVGITTLGIKSKVIRRDEAANVVVRQVYGRHTLHLVGYSPSKGFFDIATSSWGPWTKDADGTHFRRKDVHMHGSVVPEPGRRVAFWITFRGE